MFEEPPASAPEVTQNIIKAKISVEQQAGLQSKQAICRDKPILARRKERAKEKIAKAAATVVSEAATAVTETGVYSPPIRDLIAANYYKAEIIHCESDLPEECKLYKGEIFHTAQKSKKHICAIVSSHETSKSVCWWNADFVRFDIPVEMLGYSPLESICCDNGVLSTRTADGHVMIWGY